MSEKIEEKEQCQRFIQFLDEVIPEPNALLSLQEFFGYCMMPDVSFQKFLVLVSVGRCGTSTLAEVLAEAVGLDSCSTVDTDQLYHEFSRAKLIGKNLNLSFKLPSKASTPWLKSLLSGEPVPARKRFEDPITLYPKSKFVIVTNESQRLERMLKSDFAFARRALTVFFNRRISRPDPCLKEKLIAEIPGIRSWAMEGQRRLLAQGRFSDE